MKQLRTFTQDNVSLFVIYTENEHNAHYVKIRGEKCS
jgi:hypothetical protein